MYVTKILYMHNIYTHIYSVFLCIILYNEDECLVLFIYYLDVYAGKTQRGEKHHASSPIKMFFCFSELHPLQLEKHMAEY